MQNPELLAPAGNFEKLKTALRFGADAVYLGGKSFSLRSFSDNFTDEELKAAAEYVHARGKKMYVTVNIFAKNSDFSQLEKTFRFLQEIGADAALVTDAGAFALARKVAPNLPLHISTQANTTNAYAARFWQEAGAERVVLARELSLQEIAQIRDHCPGLELEAFVHGAMCISYSGRCLLSNYLAHRDSNRGACVQACRWKFDLRARREEVGGLTAEEDERGTYLLNSKDLNMLSHLEEMRRAGVCSFKIEGRMKSSYYLATVVNAYRRVLDKTLSVEEGQEELKKVAHRAFTTAYMFGDNAETVNYEDSQESGTREYVADVLADGLVQMRNRFRTGDKLEILSPTDTFNRVFTVENMEDEAGAPVQDAKLVMQKLRLSCPYPLREGDILRRV
ncbi:MAG TPA: U32 family peptidase [Candidatus Borkfalkia faecipullorum]|uniref:U32 family peptidase n=1 Tax=Candidatus Borkfalkia faecipullorum TaxID=2838510 RepID=A0A9D1V7D9_9FIRM|nr:U32 family peptidase [Candidatus Borkfalkia faecipullorum]